MTSHESLKVRDFGKFPPKMRKSPIFPQKVIISVKKIPKILTRTFRPKHFRKKSVIFPRFWGLLLVIFVILEVFFCSWFSWFFGSKVVISKKNLLAILAKVQPGKELFLEVQLNSCLASIFSYLLILKKKIFNKNWKDQSIFVILGAYFDRICFWRRHTFELFCQTSCWSITFIWGNFVSFYMI